MQLVYLLGVTCSGKSTFIQEAQQKYPAEVGSIEVGKEMRRRHPPEFFDGLGAMEKTEPEIREIYHTQLEHCRSINDPRPLRIVLVDGQPRLPSQLAMIDESPIFLWFHAEDSQLEARAVASREGKSLELALARIENDRKQLYDVLYHIHRRGGSDMLVTVDDKFEAMLHLDMLIANARLGEQLSDQGYGFGTPEEVEVNTFTGRSYDRY